MQLIRVRQVRPIYKPGDIIEVSSRPRPAPQGVIDLDGDGLPDTVIGAVPGGGLIAQDADSAVIVDLDGDGVADINVPVP